MLCGLGCRPPWRAWVWLRVPNGAASVDHMCTTLGHGGLYALDLSSGGQHDAKHSVDHTLRLASHSVDEVHVVNWMPAIYRASSKTHVAGLMPCDKCSWHDTCMCLGDRPGQVVVQVYVCSAAPMEAADIVDTTGAGDAFIASVIYGLVQAKSFEDTMRLGTVVAASKCTQLGARPGLPLRDDISAQLL